MHNLYLDAIAMVSVFGKPDLFITVTCNPKWTEITSNLLPQQMAHQRPDIVSRVFNQKLLAIIEEISVKNVFG